MPRTDDYSWLHKHYMEHRDFEAEHAVHSQYPEIVPHYHEFYELYFFLAGIASIVVFFSSALRLHEFYSDFV